MAVPYFCSIYLDIKSYEVEITERKERREKICESIQCAVYLPYTSNRQSDKTNLRIEELY